MDTVVLTMLIGGALISYLAILFIYNKYDKITNTKKLTGFDVARKLLDKNKLKNIVIIETKDNLGDSFDLRRGVIKLSSKVFHNDSISSLGVATYITHQFIWEYKNKESYMLKTSVDKALKYVIIVSYLMLLMGIMINDSAFINISISILLVVMLYYVCVLSYKLNLYNYVKEESMKTNKKDIEVNNIYTMMIFIDFKIFVTILIDGFRWLIKTLNEKK